MSSCAPWPICVQKTAFHSYFLYPLTLPFSPHPYKMFPDMKFPGVVVITLTSHKMFPGSPHKCHVCKYPVIYTQQIINKCDHIIKHKKDVRRALSWWRNMLCTLLGEKRSNVELSPECYNTHPSGRVCLLMQLWQDGYGSNQLFLIGF